MAKPFDVILCRGSGPIHDSIIIAQSVNLGRHCDWSHVGLVIDSKVFPHPKLLPDTLYVLESSAGGVLGGGVYDVISEETRVGVQIRRLDSLLEVPGDVYAYLPLLERPPLKDYTEVLEKYVHRPYDWSPLSLWSAVCSLPRPIRNHLEDADKRLFCSELVARVYQDLGLLSREFRADNVIPADFVGGGELPSLWGTPVPLESEVFLSS